MSQIHFNLGDERTDEETLYNSIFRRKSVRKFRPEALDPHALSEVSDFIGTIRPLFPSIGTEIRLLTREQVRSGVLRARARHFAALYSESKEGYLPNAGFMLQQLDLFLSSRGIGSVWQGETVPAKGVEGPTGMEFVIMLAFGRAAEEIHRSDVKEFKRDYLPQMHRFTGPEELLSAARLAPSAMNLQPWFFTGNEEQINVYCAKSRVFDRLDLVSIGIAICHIWLAARHLGREPSVHLEKDPLPDAPVKLNYVVSLRFTHTIMERTVSGPVPEASYSFTVKVDDTPERPT